MLPPIAILVLAGLVSSVRLAADVNTLVSVSLDSSSQELVITYPSTLGHRYAVAESADLQAWSQKAPEMRGNGEQQAIRRALSEPASFYQLRESLDLAIQSKITGIDYPIRLYTPEGYETNDRVYPIIYATDGQWISESFARFIREAGKEVILVTIEQGPNDRRAIDYRYPGALVYYEVLTTELIPAVESLFRVDRSDRSLCGTSYGGLLVALAMMLERPERQYFRAYLSFDGSFQDRRPSLLQLMQDRHAASPQLKAELYLTSATVYPNNNATVNRFQRELEAVGFEGLVVYRTSFAVDHYQIADPSFKAALELLYE